MNDTDLGRLFEQATRGLRSDQEVALNAWNRARWERRRARLAAVGAVVVAVALASAILVIPAGEDESAPPVDAPTATSPPTASPTVDSLGPLERREAYLEELLPVVQPVWRDAAFATLPLLETALPDTLDPAGTDAPDLVDDPVDSALAVAQLHRVGGELRVLGDDQRWRRVLVPSLQPTSAYDESGSVVRGSPLSPDGTQLAVAGSGDVLVVDLTEGTTRRFSIPGLEAESQPGVLPEMQWTSDGQHVLVGVSPPGQGPTPGWQVEASSGEVERVPYDPLVTDVASDGTAIELADWPCGLCALRRHPTGGPSNTVPLGVEMYADVAPALDEALVVARALRSWSSPRSPAEENGLLVVDPASGEPLAFLPIANDSEAQGATLHGWLDSTTVVFSVRTLAPSGTADLLVAWDFRTGELSRLSERPLPEEEFRFGLSVPQL